MIQARLSECYTVLGPLDRKAPLPLPPGAEAARALITLGSNRTDAALMDALPELGLISCYGTGFEGVDRAGRVNKGVTFAGYSFKRMRYESAEEDPKDPKKHNDKLAPLLIGKKPISRRDPDESPVTWGPFVNGAAIGAGLLLMSAGLFAYLYRRGDRQSRLEMDAVRGRNPFDPSA